PRQGNPPRRPRIFLVRDLSDELFHAEPAATVVEAAARAHGVYGYSDQPADRVGGSVRVRTALREGHLRRCGCGRVVSSRRRLRTFRDDPRCARAQLRGRASQPALPRLESPQWERSDTRDCPSADAPGLFLFARGRIATSGNDGGFPRCWHISLAGDFTADHCPRLLLDSASNL